MTHCHLFTVRSLDGSGNFNWRMVFPFEFLPIEKKVVVKRKVIKIKIIKIIIIIGS